MLVLNIRDGDVNTGERDFHAQQISHNSFSFKTQVFYFALKMWRKRKSNDIVICWFLGLLHFYEERKRKETNASGIVCLKCCHTLVHEFPNGTTPSIAHLVRSSLLVPSSKYIFEKYPLRAQLQVNEKQNVQSPVYSFDANLMNAVKYSLCSAGQKWLITHSCRHHTIEFLFI